MADNKMTADLVAEAVAPEAVAPEASKAVDYEKLVPHIVPRDESGKKSKTIRVPLNGKSIVIPRGEVVEIPFKYKLLLEKKAALRDMDDRYKDEIVSAMKAEESK